MALYDREKPKDYTRVACCGSCGFIRELASFSSNGRAAPKEYTACEYHGCIVEPTGRCSRYQPKPKEVKS